MGAELWLAAGEADNASPAAASAAAPRVGGILVSGTLFNRHLAASQSGPMPASTASGG